MSKWRIRTAQCSSSQIFRRAVAVGLVLYLAFTINTALDELVFSAPQSNPGPSQAKKKIRLEPWPSSTVRSAEKSVCLGDAVCEEGLQENPIFSFVSLKNSTLELYGMDAFNADFHRIPEEVSDWKRLTQFQMGYKLRRRKHIQPDRDCDLLLDNRVVFLDVPVHCSNDFHVFNNNIFKHLVSLEIAGVKRPLSTVTILQLKPRCQPSRVLREWYSMFAEVYSFDKLVNSGERICVKHLQYPRSFPEIFNRMLPGEKNVPVPHSRFNEYIVSRFKQIVDSSWRSEGTIKRLQVDRSSFRNQMVTILGKQTSNGLGNLFVDDQVRLQRAFESRGAKVVVLSENRDYRNLDKLLSTLGDTSVVLGPHGPALANAIFAPRRALVVELYGDYARSSRSYETMAAYQRQDHVYFDFEGYGDAGRDITEADVASLVNRVVQLFEQPDLVAQYSLANKARFWLE